jgi:hypothetical protein
MRKAHRTYRISFLILKHVATHPVINAYEIEKGLKLDRPTTLEAINVLANAGLVKIVQRKKLPTGYTMKKYDVTSAGIVALLQGDENLSEAKLSLEDVRRLAENQSSFLPLIFGEWKWFQEKHVERLAYEYLVMAGRSTTNTVIRLSEASSASSKPSPRLPQHDRVFRHDIYAFMFIDSWNSFGGIDAVQWLRAIMRNERIRQMARKEALRLRQEAREQVKDWNDCLRALRGEIPPATAVSPFLIGTKELVTLLYRDASMKALEGGKPPVTWDDIIKSVIKSKSRL